MEEYLTPEKIADKIFSTTPTTIYGLNINQHINALINDNKELNLVDLFEIIITIYMEGLCKFYNNLNIDMSLINYDYMIKPYQWIKRLGYQLLIDDENEELENPHYCKIILRNDPINTGFFLTRNTNKNYYFLINGSFEEKADLTNIHLEDIYAIFKTNIKIYKIHFKQLFTNQLHISHE